MLHNMENDILLREIAVFTYGQSHTQEIAHGEDDHLAFNVLATFISKDNEHGERIIKLKRRAKDAMGLQVLTD